MMRALVALPCLQRPPSDKQRSRPQQVTFSLPFRSVCKTVTTRRHFCRRSQRPAFPMRPRISAAAIFCTGFTIAAKRSKPQSWSTARLSNAGSARQNGASNRWCHSRKPLLPTSRTGSRSILAAPRGKTSCRAAPMPQLLNVQVSTYSCRACSFGPQSRGRAMMAPASPTGLRSSI